MSEPFLLKFRLLVATFIHTKMTKLQLKKTARDLISFHNLITYLNLQDSR